VLPRPAPGAKGVAASVDGTNIAWYRYGRGDRTILFVPTWNIVDARSVGHQVAALASHATVITYDPRGAGASDRPEHGYDFPLHAADALAVMDANGVGAASLVTASRSLNTAVLVVADGPGRVERLVAIAPYVEFEANPNWPNAERLEKWRTDWRGFIVPFMQGVFTEPDSADVIAEMTAIGLEASPDVVVAQEYELDWQRPARLLGAVSCPTLVIHGDSDQFLAVSAVQRIVDAIPVARLELIPGGGHRPDIRSPELVNLLLNAFLLD
jgi:pimeloyl-ACP methyl ester carboxylesterase